MACLGVIVAFVVIAIASRIGVFQPWEPHNKGSEHLVPGVGHWFGTDEFGRDVMARVAYGASVAMTVGLVTGVIATMLLAPWK